MTFASLVSLAACSPQPGEAPQSNTIETVKAQPAKADVPSLEGSWRVTRIDGQDAAGLGVTATLGAGKARLATGCLRRAWTYRQDRNMVSFTSSPGGSANCGRAPSGLEETAYSAIDQANIVIFASGGKQADLSGTGGNLTFERR
ncbi:MAG TPA: hypothetical protein VNA29_02420 [Sphingomicrobium sp.]|nr:hypothetical protein [Sphingomicrobium sp.]